jgi:hypothetical protein
MQAYLFSHNASDFAALAFSLTVCRVIRGEIGLLFEILLLGELKTDIFLVDRRAHRTKAPLASAEHEARGQLRPASRPGVIPLIVLSELSETGRKIETLRLRTGLVAGLGSGKPLRNLALLEWSIFRVLHHGPQVRRIGTIAKRLARTTERNRLAVLSGVVSERGTSARDVLGRVGSLVVDHRRQRRVRVGRGLNRGGSLQVGDDALE